jgi:ATP-dependent HslUV protease ATP-binding subunit HslU
VRAEKADEVQEKAKAAAEEALLDLLLPPSRAAAPGEDPAAVRDQVNRTRERMRDALRDGRLDDRIVEIEVRESAMPSFEIIAGSSVEEIGVNLKDMMGNMFQGRTKSRRLKVPDALAHLLGEEQAKLVDMESVGRAAVQRVEHAGIIFIDEIDKIASRDGMSGGGHGGPDVSREGVQRDILPIVEGTTVNTKHGMVKTDHILFIAAGAFHVSKPSDLIPELQGRFPIRVELEPLTRDDFVRILTEPRNALVKQNVALLGTEDLTISFTPSAIDRIADFGARVNDMTENIGARRLHTVMERLLDELSFEAPDLGQKTVVIDEAYVDRMLADIVRNEDLSRYIL